MRVLMYLEELNRGGIEAFVVNIIRSLHGSECEVSLLVLKTGDYDYESEIKTLGVSIDYLVDRENDEIPRSSLHRLLFYCDRMRSWMVDNGDGFDLIHVHASHLANMYPLMCAMSCDCGRRIVVHSHSSDAPSELFRIMHRGCRIFLNNIHPKALLACSEEAGKWMYGRRSFEVVPNGILFDRYRFSSLARREVREELGISSSAVVYINVARFSSEKNHEFLFRVFSCILASNRDSVLLLCGRGDLLEDMRRLVADLGMTNSVRFLGVREDIGRVLSACDCFLLPSLFEGLPVSVVEAQVNGVPVLLSDAVSSEAVMSESACALSLEVGEKAWAELASSMAVAPRVSGLPEDGKLGAYNVVSVASRLVKIYEKATI